jgi:ubiquinone/menaquinone biosynthesis C-methylase UbiE
MTIYDPSRFEIAYANFTHFVLRRYYKRFVKSLELQPNDKVIDFGSGTGFLTKLISKELVGRDSWISCVEISEKWNNIARKKFKRYPNVDFYCGMIYELDMKENFYDKIVIHWVLHDVPKEHREKIVQSMSKRLKKGGLIILRDPIGSSHGMLESEIKELMTNAGMVEVKSQYAEYKMMGTLLYATFEKK